MERKNKVIKIGIGFFKVIGFFSMYSSQIELVKPTGSYAVGTVSYHMVDKTRQEQRVHDVHHLYRELMVHVWYPAEITKKDKRVPYVSPYLSEFIQRKAEEKKGWFFGSGYRGTHVITHSYAHAVVSSQHNTYPVIIFSPGYGAPCHLYASFLEELASYGFVIFGVNHTHTSDPVEFPDGRITELAPNAFSFDETEIRYKDLCFLLNQIEQINNQDIHGILTHRLNLHQIGAMGHSMGATAALELCQKSEQCKAVIALDGMLKSTFINSNAPVEPYNKPLMIMYNVEQGTFSKDDKYTPAYDLENILRVMKEKVGQLGQASLKDVYEVQWKAHHMSFSDYFLITHLAENQEQELKNLEDIKLLMVNFFKIYLMNCSQEILIKQDQCSNKAFSLLYHKTHTRQV